MRQYHRTVILPDIHVPYEDAPSVRAAIELIKHVKPHVIVQLGDLVDFYSLSRFSKDPARQLSLQTEFDQAAQLLRLVRDAAPDAKIYMLQGNHEHRLIRYLWDKAPEMSGLRGLKIEELLGLGNVDIEYISAGMMRLSDQIVVKHGHVVRNRSAYSAAGELERLWVSGISGHTHRIGQVYRRTAGGYFTWMETGCLCQLDPEYMEGQIADWQHGVGYAEISPDRYWMTPLPILSGRVVWGGTELGTTTKATKSRTRTRPTPTAAWTRSISTSR